MKDLFGAVDLEFLDFEIKNFLYTLYHSIEATSQPPSASVVADFLNYAYNHPSDVDDIKYSFDIFPETTDSKQLLLNFILLEIINLDTDSRYSISLEKLRSSMRT